MDARPEKFLRVANPSDRGAKHCVQFLNVVKDTVGESPVHLSPYPLSRIEFGCIGRKELQANPEAVSKESPDLVVLVDGASIPEQKDKAP